MDMYIAAVCNELRNALHTWELLLVKKDVTRGELDKLRMKINGLCRTLEKLEGK